MQTVEEPTKDTLINAALEKLEAAISAISAYPQIMAEIQEKTKALMAGELNIADYLEIANSDLDAVFRAEAEKTGNRCFYPTLGAAGLIVGLIIGGGVLLGLGAEQLHPTYIAVGGVFLVMSLAVMKCLYDCRGWDREISNNFSSQRQEICDAMHALAEALDGETYAAVVGLLPVDNMGEAQGPILS